MEETKPEKSEVKFNSMTAVLERINKITYEINTSRQMRDLSGMLDHIIDYFKEIACELSPNEIKDYWEKIRVIKRFCNPLVQENNGRVLNMLDELDLSLRVSAKVHGFLTQSKPQENNFDLK